MAKHAFIFDQHKCVACDACIVACINENGFQKSGSWRQVISADPGPKPYLSFFNLSMACNHCEEAPCMKHCPALAYNKSLLSGAILHDADKCIGCQYCIWNCPYDAPRFNQEKGLIEKCNFCESRLKEEENPACIEACPSSALTLLRDHASSEISNELTKLKAKEQPSFYYSSKEEIKGPITDKSIYQVSFQQLSQQEIITSRSGNKTIISAKSEWPLLLFTFISSIVIPIYISGVSDNSDSGKILLLAIFVLGGLISITHLGQKTLFWRALLNIRNSWLSREILFFSLTLVFILTDIFLYDMQDIFLLIPGILLLISIDKLYYPAQTHWRINWHSGESLLIALSVFCLAKNLAFIFLILLIFRVTTIVYHKLKNGYDLSKNNKLILGLRIVFLIISALFLLTGQQSIAFIFFLPGEFLDRILFYEDLEIKSIKEKFISGALFRDEKKEARTSNN